MREEEAKACPLSGSTVHLDLPPQRFYDNIVHDMKA